MRSAQASTRSSPGQPLASAPPGPDSQAGLVFDIRRHALHDGPGIRTTFFLKGCPLSCPWCHNPEGIGYAPETQSRLERCISCGSCGPAGQDIQACPTGALEALGRWLSVDEAYRIGLADEAFYDSSGGGITLSGGEPLAQPAFTAAVAQRFHAAGIHVALDTSGYAPEAVVRQISPCLDLVLFDLKHSDSAAHRRLTGVPNQLILANLERFLEAGVALLVSVPLVPGLNDDAANLRATARLVAGLRIRPTVRGLASPRGYAGQGDYIALHGNARPRLPALPPATTPEVRILPYHDTARAKYLRKGMPYPCDAVPVPDQAACRRAAAYFEAEGLTTSIGGLP